MRLKQVRQRYDTERARLNRARRLYIALTRDAFHNCPDDKLNEWLDNVAAAAWHRGLWKADRTPGQKARGDRPTHRGLCDIRYALLRGWARIEGMGAYWDFSAWKYEHGIVSGPGRFDFNPKFKKVNRSKSA